MGEIAPLSPQTGSPPLKPKSSAPLGGSSCTSQQSLSAPRKGRPDPACTRFGRALLRNSTGPLPIPPPLATPTVAFCHGTRISAFSPPSPTRPRGPLIPTDAFLTSLNPNIPATLCVHRTNRNIFFDGGEGKMRRGDEGRPWPTAGGSGHGYGRSSSVPRRQTSEEQLREEITRLRTLLGQADERRRQQDFEIARLHRELENAGDSHNQFSAEIGALRGQLTRANEIYSEQVREILVLQRQLEAATADPAREQLRAEVQQLRQLINGMTPAQFTQLEDYAIAALQIELRNDARARPGPAPDAALREPREDYTGCRQFYQTGFCHFGRGRRPCPNENTHFCLQCGRAHGTAPHLVLLKRLGDGTLVSQSTLQ